MIEELLRKMFEEKQDFFSYATLYNQTEDKAAKTAIKSIAEQEMHHYKMIYDIVFKEDNTKPVSLMERGLHHQAKKWYKEMEEELKELV